MKISQVEQGQSQITLNIEVEPPELEEHLDGVYRRIVQRTNIPGFRKGKAPRAVVERYVGRDVLLEEALDSLLPSVTSRAIQERSLEVVATPRVKLAQREPLTIEATVAVRPPVELGEYHQIRLDGEKVEVVPEEVDRLVEALRREMGTWEPVERPAQLGDLITMEVRGVVGEETVVDEKGVDYILSPDSSNPMPGFGEKLVGAGRGERREFALSFPQEYPQAAMAGKECLFTVSVEEAKERKLPEMDDEFAGSLNMGVKTSAELRSKLEENLREQSQRAADRRFEEQVVQTLIEKVQVELPPLLVEDEVGHILSEQAEALGRQQVRMEEYLSNVGKSVEQLQEEVRPAAVERLTRGLVLQEVARREAIEVSPEDVEKELDSLGEGSDSGEGSLRQVLSSEEGRRSVSRMLLTRRTLERLATIARGEAVAALSSTGETSAKEGQGKPEGGA
ncbi:MAG: trigger factor [Chloroflexi bacterium]|nr:trigger factor [Chloroflexota bacterium]